MKRLMSFSGTASATPPSTRSSSVCHDSPNGNMGQLAASATSGVVWNFVSQAGQQCTQMLTMIVLARLLMPSDFGLVGMATVVIGFANLFKDLGTSSAVIQSRAVTDDLLSTVFWANVAIGVLGTLVLACTAPLAAMCFREPRTTAILSVLALNFVLSGCSNLQKTLFERDLLFRVTARIEVAGVLCGAVVGVSLAVAGAGVWALVAQSLTTTGVVSALLWAFSDWRPRLVFRWSEINRIGNYSLNLTGFNIFNYFARNADYLLIGRFLGATPLGVYTLAYRIMLYPLQTISTVISRVMFPVYSHLQDDDARFRSAYLRTAGMIALVTFPMMVGLWIIAKPLVFTIFGTKWAMVLPLIRIFAPVGLVQSIWVTVGCIYQAKGRTAAFFRWGVGSSLLLVASFLVGLRWGILGVATAYAIATLVLVLPNFVIPFRFIGLRLSDFLVALMRPLAASFLMAVALLAIRQAVANWPPLTELQVLLATGVIGYVAATWGVNRAQLRQVLALVGRQS